MIMILWSTPILPSKNLIHPSLKFSINSVASSVLKLFNNKLLQLRNYGQAYILPRGVTTSDQVQPKGGQQIMNFFQFTLSDVSGFSPRLDDPWSFPIVLLLMLARWTNRTNASTTSDIGGRNSGSACSKIVERKQQNFNL